MKNKKYLIIIASFIFVFFLRLWMVPDFFSFNFDEEYQATLAWQQVKHFHKIWIGVSASNLRYYLGPAFTYLNALLFKLSHGDPVILAYFSAFLGIISTLSIVYVTKKLFSTKASIIAGLLYGASAFLNYYDRRFWNPTPMPLIAIWMFYSLSRAKKDSRWLILSVIFFAFSFHVHLGLMVFVPVIFFVILREIKKIKLSTWILMVISYLFITFPLLVFDFVHSFDNLKAPLRFFTDKKNGVSNFGLDRVIEHTKVYFNMLSRIWFISFNTNIQNEQTLGAHFRLGQGNILLSLFSLASIGISYSASLILFLSLALFSVTFILYPGFAAEYYLLGFFALLTIAGGLLLARLPTKIIVIILTLYIGLNAVTIFTTTQAQYGLTIRHALINKVMETVKNRPFTLETYGRDPRQYHPYGGWRYLFKAYGQTPVKSFADDHFSWIYPDEISDTKPVYKVIISEEKNLDFKTPPIVKFRTGAFYAYILNY